jgi:hypothetical protein
MLRWETRGLARAAQKRRLKRADERLASQLSRCPRLRHEANSTKSCPLSPDCIPAARPGGSQFHTAGLQVRACLALWARTRQESAASIGLVSDLARRFNPTAAILAAYYSGLLPGCTPAPSERSGTQSEQAQPEQATIEVGKASGPLPVTLVLDPSGALCGSAVRFSAGERHVVCDRTAEDLAAGALRRGLVQLKAEHGPAVAPTDAWLLAAPSRAAVARALVTADPAFFSRVAVWVGDSRSTASLFGPTFWAGIAGRGRPTVLLLGPGAAQAEPSSAVAERQGTRLRGLSAEAPIDDPGTWAVLAAEFSSAPPPP